MKILPRKLQTILILLIIPLLIYGSLSSGFRDYTLWKSESTGIVSLGRLGSSLVEIKFVSPVWLVNWVTLVNVLTWIFVLPLLLSLSTAWGLNNKFFLRLVYLNKNLFKKTLSVCVLFLCLMILNILFVTSLSFLGFVH